MGILLAKNISLSDNVYNKLSQEKRPNESFSDTILRLLDHRKSLEDIVGMQLLPKDISLEEIRQAGRRTMGRISHEAP